MQKSFQLASNKSSKISKKNQSFIADKKMKKKLKANRNNYHMYLHHHNLLLNLNNVFLNSKLNNIWWRYHPQNDQVRAAWKRSFIKNSFKNYFIPNSLPKLQIYYKYLWLRKGMGNGHQKIGFKMIFYVTFS